MNPTTELLRQIHPIFVQQGKVTSQAFRPTPKDENMLSVDNGDKVSPDDALKRFINNPECSSVGVMAVTLQECQSQSLPVVEDAIPYPEHCSIDFSAQSKGQIKKKAKLLRGYAEKRDWLFRV